MAVNSPLPVAADPPRPDATWEPRIQATLAGLPRAESDWRLTASRSATSLTLSVQFTGTVAGKRAWLTGMRREQSPGRAALEIQAFDDANGLEKFNPLADWNEGQVWSYLRTYQVPYNALYDNGYRSIGCAPLPTSSLRSATR